VVTLDPRRFPRAAAYLASLPQGLESHPDCKIRDIVVEPYVRAFASIADEPGLPVPVADMLTGRARVPWHSEVLFQVVHLVVRDRGFTDDTPLLDWMQKANEEVFDKPILRNLMRLVSPTLIVLGATKRWSAFHTGSDLTADRVVESGGRAGATARLRHPPGLFSPLFLVTLERSFIAALTASRAREPQAKMMSADADRGVTEYAFSWRA
jgi:hypothetical protein